MRAMRSVLLVATVAALATACGEDGGPLGALVQISATWKNAADQDNTFSINADPDSTRSGTFSGTEEWVDEEFVFFTASFTGSWSNGRVRLNRGRDGGEWIARVQHDLPTTLVFARDGDTLRIVQ